MPRSHLTWLTWPGWFLGVVFLLTLNPVLLKQRSRRGPFRAPLLLQAQSHSKKHSILSERDFAMKNQTKYTVLLGKCAMGDATVQFSFRHGGITTLSLVVFTLMELLKSVRMKIVAFALTIWARRKLCFYIVILCSIVFFSWCENSLLMSETSPGYSGWEFPYTAWVVNAE